MTRKILVAVGSGRIDHPSGVFRLERQTLGDDVLDRRNARSTYQALMAEEREVDGKPGMLIDISAELQEARYYLTMQEAKRLAEFLTMRTANTEPETWLELGTPEAKEFQRIQRKRGRPSNG